MTSRVTTVVGIGLPSLAPLLVVAVPAVSTWTLLDDDARDGCPASDYSGNRDQNVNVIARHDEPGDANDLVHLD